VSNPVVAETDSLRASVTAIARAAKHAARVVAKSSVATRRQALQAIADEMVARRDEILAANARDLDAARAAGMAVAMQDRLMLDAGRIAGLANAVRAVSQAPDLVGRIERTETLPSGLELARMRIPLGVIAMIYEARPGVTTDAAALCLWSGNACLLRGGSEAFHSNAALGAAVAAGLARAGLPAAAVQIVPFTDRAAIAELVKLEGLVDLVIPRGGEGLIRFVAEHARVPVIKHYKGVCHIFVHAAADVEMALNIIDNAKTQRPGVCNAVETVLIDRAIAERFVPALVARLGARVELRADDEFRRLASATGAAGTAVANIRVADEADWFAEYLDLILAVRIVDGIDGAIAHIEAYASDHTESIITADAAVAERFIREVQSSTVMVNASTRFADGGELGLGAEIGISTTKIHAYGPMGAEGLTTTKFVVRGNGQVRS
jgi:glutamate-5-semialdehyde dehydrogenase